MVGGDGFSADPTCGLLGQPVARRGLVCSRRPACSSRQHRSALEPLIYTPASETIEFKRGISMRRAVVLLLFLLVMSSAPRAHAPAPQPPRPQTIAAPSSQAAPPAFTAEDMLKVSTASVLDMTDDGQWVAVSVRRGFDNAETDNRRYGDPTYVSPIAGPAAGHQYRDGCGAIAVRGHGRYPPGCLVPRRKAARHPECRQGGRRRGRSRTDCTAAGLGRRAIPARRGSSPRRLAGGRQLGTRVVGRRQASRGESAIGRAGSRRARHVQDADRRPHHRSQRQGSVPRMGRAREVQSFAVDRGGRRGLG